MLELLIRLCECALLAVCISVGFYILKKKTSFGKLPDIAQQIIIGIAFGGVAIFGTETGVLINGATINARDAGPLCAGLLFGPYAGIIAGIIGGVERWFATLWGAGAYSRLACSIATVFAGCYAAWMRVFLFGKRRPKVIFGVVGAFVTEAVHLLILFLTHLDDPVQAMSILDVCLIPMMLANALAVGLTMLGVEIFNASMQKNRKKTKTLTDKIQTRLLIAFVICYLFTTTFAYLVQTNSALETCSEQLETGVNDVIELIEAESDSRAEKKVAEIASRIEENSADELMSLAETFSVAEIETFNMSGEILSTTNEQLGELKLTSSKLGKEILNHVKSNSQMSFTTQFERHGLTNTESNESIKYAVSVTNHDEICIVGFDSESYRKLISDEELAKYTSSRHAGSDGFFIIASPEGEILSIPDSVSSSAANGEELKYRSLTSFGFTADNVKRAKNVYTASRRDGTKYYVYYDSTEAYNVFGLIEEKDVFYSRDNSANFNSLMEIIVYAILYTIVFFMINHFIIKKLQKVNENLENITSGNLDEKVNERSTAEFEELSDSINSTVDALKGYIAAESARINKDLSMATTIQNSVLPQNFSTDKNYEIYATMKPAKQVGGDFYDFYLLGENKLAFLIADVSGKGLPAAMFMMQAKMIIKGLMESGHKIDEAFSMANDELCKNNEAEMFVTSWMGVLDLDTGCLEYVNAGHNPPAVKKADGKFGLIPSPAGFVLAGMGGVKYKARSVKLSKGDMIFLYTDGVTEATDLEKQLYGEDRLISCLSANADRSCEAILKGVKADIDAFVGGADQFDDITMLAVRFG